MIYRNRLYRSAKDAMASSVSKLYAAARVAHQGQAASTPVKRVTNKRGAQVEGDSGIGGSIDAGI
jgi:hypothetical protein